MMNTKNTGGAAFSRASPISSAQEGMSLRAYFAAHAPITLKDARTVWDSVCPDNPTGPQLQGLLAKLRWQHADAMLAESEEQ
jgi:hypothetical protein